MARGRHVCALAAAALLAMQGACAAGSGQSNGHRFGVIGHSFNNGGEEHLKQAIADTGEASIAFVVVTGIKGAAESCSDKLYLRRRAMIAAARRPMIVVPAASDWSACVNSAGRSAGIERLNRLRELFFREPASLGARALPLKRLSASAKFRSYAENAHWEIGNVLYATVNLPANNNNYRPEAGRNSEYEDRLVANRFWLNRVFALARRKKLAAVVLFSEGDMKALAQETGLRALLRRAPDPQDGFAAPRRQIGALVQKFQGKVLLVDTGALPKGAEPAIEWRDKLGHVSLGTRVVEVSVAPGTQALFTLRSAL